MVQPQSDPWLLRWDLTKTNFLDRDLPPAFLYYNPGPGEKRVVIQALESDGRVYDLSHNRPLHPHRGSFELTLGAREARVIEIRR
jgi:hypothetical protein